MTIERGEPSYSILAHVTNDYHVNRYDEFSIDLYISGDGNIDYASLLVSIPPSIIKNEEVYFFQRKYDIHVEQYEENYIGQIVNLHWVSEKIGPRFNININKIVLSYYGSNKFGFEGKLVGEGHVGERYYAPFRIKFVISGDAPTGDQNINILLKYRSKSSSTVYLDKQVFTIHINHWYEKDWTKAIPVFALIFAFLSLPRYIIATVSNLIVSAPREYIFGVLCWLILILIIFAEFRKSNPQLRKII
ncbi:hypothetical protein [Methanothrix harundinacea]|uniref:hypothetical protein n=1 Tax=Methanothrix harundinacea TaxID=301375 RepID=UPI00117BF112|nr:hypothetical protein [Methanothrix harundinacea]